MSCLYQAEYYRTGCGPVPYEQAEHWQPFFDRIADQIVDKFHPRTVLDAGCAMGYLVSALRDRGVEAYGVDLSEYALSKVRPDVRPYCFAGSITEPLPQAMPRQYDLVVTIEVLEHLTAQDGQTAIANLCAMTDTVLFSSSPDDFTEPTHINVQQREYWARLFALQGFWDDLDSRPDAITSHAACYRRHADHLRQVDLYERHIRLTQAAHSRQLEQAAKRPFTASLFWAGPDRDFDPQRRFTVSGDAAQGEIRLSVSLPREAVTLRLDPMEGPCLVEDLDVRCGDGPLAVRAANGLELDHQYLFLNDDPQFDIDTQGRQLNTLELRARVLPLEHPQLRDLLQRQIARLEPLDQALAEARKDLIQARRELDDGTRTLVQTQDALIQNQAALLESQADLAQTRKELAAVQEAYLQISRSSSWRITKPLRLLAEGVKSPLRRIKILSPVKKVWWSLRDHGLIYTLKKVWRKLFRPGPQFASFHPLTEEERQAQRQTVFSVRPKFSLVVPLYNTPPAFLKEMVSSVQAQTYGSWELCMADGSEPANQELKKLCLSFSKKDPRIRYKQLPANAGIAGNTLAAFELASGDYIVLLDHDDVLTENALYECVKCIQDCPEADFIYSDKAVFEDKTRKILGCHYLPDYSPDYLRATNYASHLNLFSRDLIDRMGFLQEGYDGSQDYDLELRAMEHARQIRHIPMILYYCRACEGSVALDPESKRYAYEAGRRAIEAHIQRIGYPGKVEFESQTYSYRIHYDIVNPGKVSIIIPNKDHIQDLETCVRSILDKTDYPDYEVLIVENCSQDKETFKGYRKLSQDPRVRVITYVPAVQEFNFSAINNFAVSQTDSPYVLFLNNDTSVISKGWLREMLMYAQRDDVGAVGAKLYFSNDTYQHVGLFLGLGEHIATHYAHRAQRGFTGYMHRLAMVQNYNAVTGACMLMKRADFLAAGGFDEENFKVGLNDVDLCLKLRSLGKVNVLTPYAELYHYESLSRSSDEEGPNKVRFRNEQARFRAKWPQYFDRCDEYYNPNLNL